MPIREKEGKTEIFDPVRKKWVLLTEEEKVRQYCIHQLINRHRFPVTLMAVEKQIPLNGLTKRYDIVVFNRSGHPYLVIECKAPSVKLDQSVLEQVARYNATLKAEIIGVTNGLEYRFFKIDFNTLQITEINFEF
ncbi:MAG: hypothetical protein H6Q25_271 [Bacteroidetes bacterium]|nr:hypothetical protein [Bacteroidota bacterium]